MTILAPSMTLHENPGQNGPPNILNIGKFSLNHAYKQKFGILTILAMGERGGGGGDGEGGGGGVRRGGVVWGVVNAVQTSKILCNL